MAHTYINIRGIYVIRIRNTINFLQYYTIIVIWNALLVLIFLFIIFSQCVSTRVCFYLYGGLYNKKVTKQISKRKRDESNLLRLRTRGMYFMKKKKHENHKHLLFIHFFQTGGRKIGREGTDENAVIIVIMLFNYDSAQLLIEVS